MRRPMTLDPEARGLRALPGVSALLRRPAVEALVVAHGHAIVVEAIRAAVNSARQVVLAGGDAAVTDADIAARAREIKGGTLKAVLNATGVVVHTNLGRAPLAPEALRAVAEVAAGYSTLEYDLSQGARSDRHRHAVSALIELTLAEDAIVVNNNAAAILLVLSSLATRREVIVSRGELVEIGGGFRVPDVLVQSGASLVEVGTTNRTHASDYADAIGENTALLLKVHRSNFEMVGFTAEVGIAALARIAHARGLSLVVDAGSGCLLADGGGEETVAAQIAAGADVVTFSGDKLLGGPQAGIIAGKKELLGPMRRHPLFRALRPDKMCLAALLATLTLWRTSPERIPVARMVAAPLGELNARAARLAAAVRGAAPSLSVSVVPAIGRIGGGASPSRELVGRAVRIAAPKPMLLARALRESDPPVVARVEDDALFLDPRCVSPADDEALARSVLSAIVRYQDG